MTVQLDAEQIDALSEIFNIGVGKAAAAMGALMHDEVLLSVPHVSIFTVSEAAQQLGAAGSTMYGVRQPFRGTFNGDALLIFPGQHLSRDEQVALAHRFGGLEIEITPIRAQYRQFVGPNLGSVITLKGELKPQTIVIPPVPLAIDHSVLL